MKIKSWMLMLIASGRFPLAMVLIIERECEETMNLVYRKNKIIIVSVIDNMVKGAAGQAIQNMNILLGLPQNTGLKLIAPSF